MNVAYNEDCKAIVIYIDFTHILNKLAVQYVMEGAKDNE